MILQVLAFSEICLFLLMVEFWRIIGTIIFIGNGKYDTTLTFQSNNNKPALNIRIIRGGYIYVYQLWLRSPTNFQKQ